MEKTLDLCSPRVIRSLMSEHGAGFSKALGQNFLINKNVVEKIAVASGASPETGVLEIGPGLGSLTRELSKSAGRVVAVELDKTFFGILSRIFAGCPYVRIINGIS